MDVVRIAMWSGPRNISTAMMYSFGNRDDAVCVDEPLYAHYLKATGKPHPGADEVMARHETDWQEVVRQLTGPVPAGKTVFFQKHMAHHLLPDIGLDWLPELFHAFLIREPKEMLTSLINQIPDATLEDTGLPQQRVILRRMLDEGAAPPVLDSKDVLQDPRGMLAVLCERAGIPFSERMLSWDAGRKEFDGAWGPHWYDAVWRSTGFQPYKPKGQEVPPAMTDLLAQCDEIYDELYQHRITAD